MLIHIVVLHAFFWANSLSQEVTETPPGQLPEFRDVISRSALIGPTESDREPDATNIVRWGFKPMPSFGRSFLRMASAGTTHINFLIEKLRTVNGKKVRGKKVSDGNQVNAEVFIPMQNDAIGKVPFLSMGIQGTEIEKLLSISWVRKWQGYSDVIVVSFRPTVNGRMKRVFGAQRPKQEAPPQTLKFFIEAWQDRLTVKIDGKTVVDSELTGYSDIYVFGRAGLTVQETTDEEAEAEVFFEFLDWKSP